MNPTVRLRSIFPPSGTPMKRLVPTAIVWAIGAVGGQAQPFEATFERPSMDRWMYPFNASPGSRPSAPVFGTLGDEAGVDSRHGQFLVGFDLSERVPPGLGAEAYLIRRVRLSVTVARDLSFVYDPTEDPFATYFAEGHPDGIPDTDPGRPIDLFAVGFRNGYTAETFLEDSPFGGSAVGERNAYASGHDVHGEWEDVGNNVGKTDDAFPPFEVFPFAVGRTDEVQPGEPVPAGTTFRFDLKIEDPFVLRYVREACDTGRLRLMLTGLHTASLGGAPAWPDFFTADSAFGAAPTLELEGTAVRLDLDTDGDGLPDDWEMQHFGGLDETADGDADGDGQSNLDEWMTGTTPTDPGSRLAVEILRSSADARLTVRFRHAAVGRYVIESSTDLRSWVAVPSSALRYDHAKGTAEWRETPGLGENAEGPRFYRVVVP